MRKVWKNLVSLERSLKPPTRWLLTGIAAVAGLYYASAFGEKLGRALYYLTH